MSTKTEEEVTEDNLPDEVQKSKTPEEVLNKNPVATNIQEEVMEDTSVDKAEAKKTNDENLQDKTLAGDSSKTESKKKYKTKKFSKKVKGSFYRKRN